MTQQDNTNNNILTSFQIFAARLVSCKLIDIYLFMMRQGARAKYRERGGQGNKQVYPPPAAKRREVWGTV